MIDEELLIPIVLGAAFSALYWVFDAAATAVAGLSGTLFQVLTVGMVIVWSLLAAYLLSPDPRSTADFREDVIVLGLYWAVLFGGVAAVVTVVFASVAMVIWPAGVATTSFFGMVLGATVVLGILAIVLGGVVRRDGLPAGI